VAVCLPGRRGRSTIGGPVARQALPLKVCRLRGWGGDRMRIVAGPTPKFFAAGPLARALREVFGVAGHLSLRHRTGAHKNDQAIRERLAGRKRLFVPSRLGNSNFAGEVALLADTVPRGGSEFRRIHHGLAPGDMVASRAVTSLAGHASFRERRRRVAVLGTRNMPDSARV